MILIAPSIEPLGAMMSVLEDTKPCDLDFRTLAPRLRQAVILPILAAAALLLVLLGVLGVLLWPAWSADARKRRLGIMTALAGGDWPE